MPKKRFSLIKVFNTLYGFYGPQAWWPADTRLEMIIGAILTQNTAWANVEKAIANLKKEEGLLSFAALKKIDTKRLASLIRPAGYYKVKSRRLKNFISFLWKRYGGDLNALARRNTVILREELLAVNGIGPETCDSILLYAFKRPVFVVDAYTKRIFSRHGFFRETVSYEEAQGTFMRNLAPDQKLFNEYHALIVRLAKGHCKKNPDCGACPLKGMKTDKIACK